MRGRTGPIRGLDRVPTPARLPRPAGVAFGTAAGRPTVRIIRWPSPLEKPRHVPAQRPLAALARLLVLPSAAAAPTGGKTDLHRLTQENLDAIAPGRVETQIDSTTAAGP